MKEFKEFKDFRKVRQRFTLRARLVLTVTLEIIASIALALVVDWIFVLIFDEYWNIPLIVDIFIISACVGIFATNALTRWYFNPMKKVTEAMDKISEGDYSVRLETNKRANEIHEIYSGFNMMAKELQSTEILQSDFVSNVSHEFKTPIAAIEGYSMLLQDDDNLTDEQKEYVDKIIFNTQRLSSLTASMLLLSRIESKSIVSNKVKFDLDEQIRKSILAFEREWDAKSIDFDIEMNDTDYVGNEGLLRHIWDNIIGNAIKFSPDGGKIVIRLSNLENKIVFSVSDEGPGISEESVKHIFDKFYQSDTSHKQEGHGLGLALAKKIVDLEDGKIDVQNNEIKGCTFTVTLDK